MSRKSSEEPERKDKCLECKADLSKAAKSIECDFCRNWYCFKCSKLKQVLFNEIAKAQDVGILWTCTHCRIALPGIKDLMSRLAVLEVKVDKLSKAPVHDDLAIEKEVIRSIVREEKKEEEEICARKLNVVVHALPESEYESVEERKEDDLSTLKSIINDTLNLDLDIVNPVRLGRKPNSERPRPMKFSVADFESKRRILGAGKKLKNHQDYSSVYFTPDLTKSQRDAAFQLREEKRRREKAGERDLVIRNWKIVTRKSDDDHSYTKVTKSNSRSHSSPTRVGQDGRVGGPSLVRAGSSFH